MNASFETIRKELKKYNAEENEAPVKLLVAGINDFLEIKHKRRRNSQFIIGVKEFFKSETSLVERMLDGLETRSGRRPLAFLYDNREAIETAISDFEDYYNMPLDKDVFQRIGSPTGQGNVHYYLIIVVLETNYFS
jgi:predicted DNA-binding protein